MKLAEKYYKELQRLVTQELLDDMVPMDITPAAKWFLSDAQKEYWEYRGDFPCILPPAPVTWIEYEMPPIIRADNREIIRPARSVAILAMTLEIPEDQQEDTLRYDHLPSIFQYFLRQSQVNYGTAVQTDRRPQHAREALDAGLTAKWITIWQMWAEPLNKRVIIPFVAYAFYLDQNGQAISDLALAHVLNINQPVPDEHLVHSFADTLPFFFALSLTHCKNVEIVEREIPPAIRKARKAKEIPELVYKQLLIKPVGGKRFLDQDKTNDGQKGMQPLHFVRAHFKTFTEERPLFGKHSGTYFWHMTAKGNVKHGQIVKEYQVKEGVV